MVSPPNCGLKGAGKGAVFAVPASSRMMHMEALDASEIINTEKKAFDAFEILDIGKKSFSASVWLLLLIYFEYPTSLTLV